MVNLFKVTYASGVVNLYHAELAKAEDLANQLFGQTLDEIKMFGANVELRVTDTLANHDAVKAEFDALEQAKVALPPAAPTIVEPPAPAPAPAAEVPAVEPPAAALVEPPAVAPAEPPAAPAA